MSAETNEPYYPFSRPRFLLIAAPFTTDSICCYLYSFITPEEDEIPTRRQNIKFDHKISTLFVVHKTTLNHPVTSQYIKILL